MRSELKDYVQSIVDRVEPEILSSLDEIRRACPSADTACRRGYSRQIKISSLDEIEQINLLHRDCERRRLQGEDLEVDHAIPLFKGGSHSLENLQLLTVEQHRLKSRQDRLGTKFKDSTRKPA